MTPQAAGDEERTHAVELQQTCSCHVAGVSEEQVTLFCGDCPVRLIVVGQHAIVLHQIHGFHMAQVLEQKVMMPFHSDCRVELTVVGHSMKMMMVEQQAKVGHKILVNYTVVI
jgi:hypothetical protein